MLRASSPWAARRTAYVSGAFGLGIHAQLTFLVALRARELGASFDIIGLIIGAGAVAPALFAVVAGAVVDRLGPRSAFLLGTGASGLLAIGLAAATSYWWLLALQPLMGIVRNLGWLASQGYVTSLGTGTQKAGAAGRFSFFVNLGQMAGPVLAGGVAQVIGYQGALLFPAVYSFVFFVMGLRLAETRVPEHRALRAAGSKGLRPVLDLVVLRGVQIALLLTFTRLWISLVYRTFLPVFLAEGGMDPGVVGAVMATSGFVGAVTAPTTGILTRLVPPTALAVTGLVSGGAGLVVAPYLAAVPVVFAVPALVGIGQGLSLPLLLAIITSAAPEERRGMALGLRSMVNEIAATVAPVAMGPVMVALGMAGGFLAGGVVVAALLAAASTLAVAEARRTPSDRRERAG